MPNEKKAREWYIEHAEELAQKVVNHWGANFKAQATTQDKLPDEFMALLNKAFTYRDAKTLTDNHRQFNMLTEGDQAKEREARLAFAETYKAIEDSL